MTAPKNESTAEFTLKAVVAGIVLGLVFGAANAYLGLKVGLTVSASIPAAVMTVAVFRLFKTRGTILEANLSQTIGSASTSLATGTIFTIPALYLWGLTPHYLQVVALAFLGAVLGLAAMIPLRRLLIVREHAELPYPEGTACAEVLRATTGESSGGAWIFRGILIGAAVKLLLSLAFLIPKDLIVEIPHLPRAQLAIELVPSLIGVGFILGFRQSGVLVAGAIVSALTLTPLIAWFGADLQAPLYPETKSLVRDMNAGDIWSRYVRYIGAGAVATAGIVTVIKNLPSMYGAVSAVLAGLRKRESGVGAANERTDRDLPGTFVIGAIAAVIVVLALVPGIFAGDMSVGQRVVAAIGVAIFGVLFVTVAARIVGIVGVSSQPTSGITLVTLLGIASVFAALGWTGLAARAAVLTVGTVVAVAASKAGDISQDLKTGYLVGATPARQQVGQLIGAAFACWAVAATVMLIGSTYEFGGTEFAAPQATLMKTIIEGVLAGDLPWGLVLTGMGVAVSASLCGVSALAFAIGVYLPLATMAAIFVGGCVRALCDRGAKAETATHKGDTGILAASGLVAGEGLAGLLVAGLVAAKVAPKSMTPRIGGGLGETLLVLTIFAIGFFLWRASRSGRG